MSNSKLSKSTLRMIKKYGKNLCLKALHSNEIVGNGTMGIAWDLKVHHNTANALCNVGREIANQDPDIFDQVWGLYRPDEVNDESSQWGFDLSNLEQKI